MARSITFYQNHYRDEQLQELYPFATPNKNDGLTVHFENSVIADLVPKVDTDLVSVCSWRLRAKRADCIRTTGELTEEKLCTYDYDVAVLTPRSPTHDVLGMAAHWHGLNWDRALNKLRDFIRVPTTLKHVIYENHFAADTALYRHYVLSTLIPAMAFMEAHPAVYLASGHYAHRKSPAEAAIIKDRLGLNDWPIGVFVLERLFSIWLQYQDVKVIPL